MDDKECSKLGGGFRRRVPVVAIDKRVPELAYDYDEQFHHQHDGVTETFGNYDSAGRVGNSISYNEFKKTVKKIKSGK
jgi:hypothetical protein